jgi:thymidylate synthase
MMDQITETLSKLPQKSPDLSASKAFKRVLTKCRFAGNSSAPRGQKVREIILETQEINPAFPLPSFQARAFNYKYFAGELAWYLKGSRSPELINNFSSFWKGLTDAGGAVNSNYGNLLFYSNQLIWAYESLAKDKDSRQAVSFVSNPKFQYEGNKDFVCTLYLNFWIRENKLYMKVQMRSNDLFYGFTYDVPFFAIIMQTMWYNLKKVYPDLQLGSYYHCADNIHYYERHFELAEKILDEEDQVPEFVFLKEPLFWIYSDHLRLTESTLAYEQDMKEIVESGNITQENCKNALRKLFIIQ